jgi:predicted GIY-YIG superfamily endonuclease
MNIKRRRRTWKVQLIRRDNPFRADLYNRLA